MFTSKKSSNSGSFKLGKTLAASAVLGAVVFGGTAPAFAAPEPTPITAEVQAAAPAEAEAAVQADIARAVAALDTWSATKTGRVFLAPEDRSLINIEVSGGTILSIAGNSQRYTIIGLNSDMSVPFFYYDSGLGGYTDDFSYFSDIAGVEGSGNAFLYRGVPDWTPPAGTDLGNG